MVTRTGFLGKIIEFSCFNEYTYFAINTIFMCMVFKIVFLLISDSFLLVIITFSIE